MIHSQTAFFLVGVFYAVLPLAAWTILHKRHDRVSVGMWCLGSFFYGAGYILVGLRPLLAPWMTFAAANVLSIAAYPLRICTLRRELGRPEHRRWHLLAWAGCAGAYLYAYAAFDGGAPRLLVSMVNHLAGVLCLAWLAWQLYRQRGFHNGAWLAVAYGLFASALVWRALFILAHWPESDSPALVPDFSIVFAFAFVAALYGNLGYIGIALEATWDKDLASGAALAREQERRLQSELRLQEQAALLEERSQLLAHREEMLAALAHEVRQPLNNASAALQGAIQAVRFDPSGDRQQAGVRLERATAVLNQVAAALDNTLTDAALLGGDAPLPLHDTDVNTLVQLAMADMETRERHRITHERATVVHTASMNAGLVRLALRNLIANALAYSPPDTPVLVRVEDSEEPLALVIDVQDRGPGFPPELLPRLFVRGARGDAVHNRLGHGLGLHIVRRVMQMHGGSVRALLRPGGGLTMRLTIPQE